jgi:tRNA pseudouridine38-40 synthase
MQSQRLTSTSTSTTTTSSTTPTPPTQNFVPEHFKKRKVALRVLFDGTEFSGSQIQPGLEVDKSVEHALKIGLYRAGMITPLNVVDVHKIGWVASSRLDRGVHSLAFVLAAKLEVDTDWFDEDRTPANVQSNIHADPAMLRRLNAHLPPSVRVADACRVAAGFQPRHLTYRREYTYYLPADAFGPGAIERVGLDQLNKLLQLFVGKKRNFSNFSRISNPRYDSIMTFLSPPHAALERNLTALAPRSPTDGDGLVRFVTGLLLAQAKYGRSWRVRTTEAFADATFDELLARMVGVTATERPMLDAIAKFYDQDDETRTLFAWRMRQCLWFHHEETFERAIYSATMTPVRFPDKSQWFAVHIAGESFVYHQIRRMIGALGLVVLGHMTPEDLNKSMLCTPFWRVMPLAPSGNLILAHTECHDLTKAELFADEPVSPSLRAFRDLKLFSRMASLREQWARDWNQELVEPDEVPLVAPDMQPLSFDDIAPQQMFSLLAHNGRGGAERDAVGVRALHDLWQARFALPLNERRAVLRHEREERIARHREEDAMDGRERRWRRSGEGAENGERGSFKRNGLRRGEGDDNAESIGFEHDRPRSSRPPRPKR